jgi:hypothetical protein
MGFKYSSLNPDRHQPPDVRSSLDIIQDSMIHFWALVLLQPVRIVHSPPCEGHVLLSIGCDVTNVTTYHVVLQLCTLTVPFTSTVEIEYHVDSSRDYDTYWNLFWFKPEPYHQHDRLCAIFFTHICFGFHLLSFVCTDVYLSNQWLNYVFKIRLHPTAICIGVLYIVVEYRTYVLRIAAVAGTWTNMSDHRFSFLVKS